MFHFCRKQKKKMKHLSCIVTLLIFQTVNLFSQQNTSRVEQHNQVDSIFESIFSDNQTGASFVIIRDGQTVYKNSKGIANIEHNVHITDTTVFNIASISKQFTTYLVLLMIEEGGLSLDDDIKTFLPELNHLTNDIKIKDLMNHTHGLPNVDELAYLKGILPDGGMTNDQIVEMLLNIKQSNFDVSEKYEYNNTGYVLLAEIIERVGQSPFELQLNQKIFMPLGMNNANAVGDKFRVVPNMAYSYQKINNKYVNHPKKLSTLGSSGIYASIRDMAIWAKNYQNPKLGKKAFYNKMEQPTILTSGKKIKYGLGLQFDTYKELNIVFHGGGTEGYRSYILHIPDHNLSLVVMANTNDFAVLDLIYAVIDVLMIDYMKVKEDVEQLNYKALKQYAGNYEFQPGVYYTIIEENNQLFFQSFGSDDKTLLPYSNGNTFLIPFIPYSHLTFYEDRFDFHIADFTYECYKSNIQSAVLNEIGLARLTGIFKNIEHKITYELSVVKDKLTLIRPLGKDVVLHSIDNQSAFSSEFGKLDFTFNSKGGLEGFLLSGQNFKNVVFVLQN